MKLSSSTLLFFNTSPRSHQRTWGDVTISSSFNQKSSIVAFKPLKSSPVSISDFYNVMNGAGVHPQASTTFPSSDNLLGTNSLFIDGSLSLVAVLVFCVGLLGLYLQVNRDDSSDLLITADPAIVLDEEEESITTAEFDDVDVVEITLDDDKEFKEQMELEITEELRAKELSEQLRLKEEEERKIQEQRAAEEEAEAIARAEEERLEKEAAEAEAEAIARAEQELQEKLLEEKRLKEEAEAAARAEQELQEKLMEEKRLEEEAKAAAAALAEENARAETLVEKKNSERQTVDNLISFIRKENTSNVKKEKGNSKPEKEVIEVENAVPVLSKSNQITKEEEEVVVGKIEDNVKQTTEVVVKLKPKKKVLKSSKSIKMFMKKKSIISFALFLVLGQRFLQIAVKRFIL